MKPTEIVTPLRTIRLAYQNEQAPNETEARVLLEYPKLHAELHRLEVAFGEFEQGLPGHKVCFAAAKKAFDELEPLCLRAEYFFLKPDEEPPAGVELPDTMGTADTNRMIEQAQLVHDLMQPLYDWNEDVHVRYKQWYAAHDDFRTALENWQGDVSLVNQHWKEGTIDISALDEDEQEYYGHVDALWNRLKSFSWEYKEVVVAYNEFCGQLRWAFEVVNTVGEKVEQAVRDHPANPDNISLN